MHNIVQHIPRFFLLLAVFGLFMPAAQASGKHFAPPCIGPAPANLQVVNITGTTASVKWDPVPDAYDYEVTVAATPVGSVPQTFYTSSAHQDLTGLQPLTEYVVRVRSTLCQNGDYGDYAEKTFRTSGIVIDDIAYLVAPELPPMPTYEGNGGTFFACLTPYNLRNPLLPQQMIRMRFDWPSHYADILLAASSDDFRVAVESYEVSDPSKVRLFQVVTVDNDFQVRIEFNSGSGQSPQWEEKVLLHDPLKSVEVGDISIAVTYTGYMKILCAPEERVGPVRCNEGGGSGRASNTAAAGTFPGGIEATAGSRAGSAPEAERLAVSVAPNPFSDQITLRLTAPETGEATLILYNALGHIVEFKTIPLDVAGAGVQLHIPTAGLPAGIYLAAVRLRDEQITLRLLKP